MTATPGRGALDRGFRLETARLYIRALGPADLDALHVVLSDADSMRYYPAPFTRAQTRHWIERCVENYEAHGFGLWGLQSKATGKLIGDCGLVPQVVDGTHEVEIGWHVRRDHQGLGLATEAAIACRDHGFATVRLPRLISLIRPVNVPSRRVAEKVGMAIDREVRWGPQRWRHLVYAVARDAWTARSRGSDVSRRADA